VDAVERGAEIEGARAERIGGAAGHEARQVGAAAQHLGGRAPVRPLGLAGDGLGAAPAEARTADADAVADGGAAGLDEVEAALLRVDDDGARRIAAGEGHRLARDGGDTGAGTRPAVGARRDAHGRIGGRVEDDLVAIAEIDGLGRGGGARKGQRDRCGEDGQEAPHECTLANGNDVTDDREPLRSEPSARGGSIERDRS
jgi:hypothetical protein